MRVLGKRPILISLITVQWFIIGYISLYIINFSVGDAVVRISRIFNPEKVADLHNCKIQFDNVNTCNFSKDLHEKPSSYSKRIGFLDQRIEHPIFRRASVTGVGDNLWHPSPYSETWLYVNSDSNDRQGWLRVRSEQEFILVGDCQN